MAGREAALSAFPQARGRRVILFAPTFRGAGGLWRNFRAEDLATPEAFRRDPALVWEWYEWRRGIIREALPDTHTWVREKVLRRNLKWSASGVPEERRAERCTARQVRDVMRQLDRLLGRVR